MVWRYRLSTGQFTSFPVSDPGDVAGKAVKGSGRFGITVVPDGDPWYTMMAANKVATLQLR